jgi:Raf kinase inhibitor-like YbhB/YbcL family protein
MADGTTVGTSRGGGTMPKLHLGEFDVTSPAFEHGGPMPVEHTADGEDTSPALSWTNVPEGTEEIVVICHDPDAPTTWGFTHWVLYGIRPDIGGLPEGGGLEYTSGTNDFGREGYGGPAPPPGHGPHQYYFHAYTLRAPLDAPPGLDRREVLRRIDDLIIEQARVIATYERPMA